MLLDQGYFVIRPQEFCGKVSSTLVVDKTVFVMANDEGGGRGRPLPRIPEGRIELKSPPSSPFWGLERCNAGIGERCVVEDIFIFA